MDADIGHADATTGSSAYSMTKDEEKMDEGAAEGTETFFAPATPPPPVPTPPPTKSVWNASPARLVGASHDHHAMDASIVFATATVPPSAPPSRHSASRRARDEDAPKTRTRVPPTRLATAGDANVGATFSTTNARSASSLHAPYAATRTASAGARAGVTHVTLDAETRVAWTGPTDRNDTRRRRRPGTPTRRRSPRRRPPRPPSTATRRASREPSGGTAPSRTPRRRPARTARARTRTSPRRFEDPRLVGIRIAETSFATRRRFSTRPRRRRQSRTTPPRRRRDARAWRRHPRTRTRPARRPRRDSNRRPSRVPTRRIPRRRREATRRERRVRNQTRSEFQTRRARTRRARARAATCTRRRRVPPRLERPRAPRPARDRARRTRRRRRRWRVGRARRRRQTYTRRVVRRRDRGGFRRRSPSRPRGRGWTSGGRREPSPRGSRTRADGRGRTSGRRRTSGGRRTRMESAIESASASPRASSLVSSRIRIVVAARCASLASILPSGPKTRVSRPGASAGETHATSPATVRVPATGPTDPNRHVVPPREGGYPRPDNDTTVPPAEDTAEGVARCVAVDEGHAATAAPSWDARAAVSSVDANSTPRRRETHRRGAKPAREGARTPPARTKRRRRTSRASRARHPPRPRRRTPAPGNPRRFRPKIQATSPPAPGPSRGYTSNTLGARHRSASATVATVPILTPGGRGDSPSVTSEGANRPARADPPPGSDWSACRISTATRRGPVVHVIGATHTTARLSTVDARTHIVPMTHPGPLCDGASAATVAESSAAAGVSSAVETARANPSPATTTSAAPVDEDVSRARGRRARGSTSGEHDARDPDRARSILGVGGDVE